MLIVVALDGNALLRRGEPMTAESQRPNLRIAAKALAPVAAEHQLVIVHGSGPAGGLLALQGAAYAKVERHPLEVLTAQTEETIGYMIEQELGNLLPFERAFATILTMVEVDPHDAAFKNPTRFIGPEYLRDEAERLSRDKGWVFKPEGDKWRRVVASPEPKRIVELGPIKWLLERNTIVIAAGGGGIPVMREPRAGRKLSAVECVIDEDLVSELLAREVNADVFVLLTDADAVYVDWDKPTRKAIRRASPDALGAPSLATSSMGRKIEVAYRFVKTTGKHAAIGALADIRNILAGEAGTTVSMEESGIVFERGLAEMARGGRSPAALSASPGGGESR
jgi:carbamate kinase